MEEKKKRKSTARRRVYGIEEQLSLYNSIQTIGINFSRHFWDIEIHHEKALLKLSSCVLIYPTLPRAVNPHAALLECLDHQRRHFTKERTRHGGMHGVRKLIRKVKREDRRPGVVNTWRGHRSGRRW
jgi:hypothetical protein